MWYLLRCLVKGELQAAANAPAPDGEIRFAHEHVSAGIERGKRHGVGMVGTRFPRIEDKVPCLVEDDGSPAGQHEPARTANRLKRARESLRLDGVRQRAIETDDYGGIRLIATAGSRKRAVEVNAHSRDLRAHAALDQRGGEA